MCKPCELHKLVIVPPQKELFISEKLQKFPVLSQSLVRLINSWLHLQQVSTVENLAGNFSYHLGDALSAWLPLHSRSYILGSLGGTPKSP